MYLYKYITVQNYVAIVWTTNVLSEWKLFVCRGLSFQGAQCSPARVPPAPRAGLLSQHTATLPRELGHSPRRGWHRLLPGAARWSQEAGLSHGALAALGSSTRSARGGPGVRGGRPTEGRAGEALRVVQV